MTLAQKQRPCDERSSHQQDKAATKIQASFRGYKTRKTLTMKAAQENKENTDDIDLSDPDLSKAATKIQASFRGHKARKDMKDTCHSDTDCTSKDVEEDVDLGDPDLEKAATKIQATFRGYKVRKIKDAE